MKGLRGMQHTLNNLTVLFSNILGGFAHADWDGAWARTGLWGWVTEFFAAFSGFNAWPFFVDAHGPWTTGRVAALLQANGVATWGWGYHSSEFYFRVKMRQAHWAQYLLLRSAVPLKGRLLETTPGSRRAAGPDAEIRPSAESGVSKRANPLQQLDNLLDRISGL